MSLAGRIVDAVRVALYHRAWKLGLWKPKDRELLEDVVLPHYAADSKAKTVVFVGVRQYNVASHALFRGKRYATFDPDPAMAPFGAPEHHVEGIERIGAHFEDGSVDVIVMNGVLGFGLDDVHAANEALAACRRALGVGGHLVLGVNPEKPSCPPLDALEALSTGFSPTSIAPLGEPVTTVTTPFRERTHQLRFYAAR